MLSDYPKNFILGICFVSALTKLSLDYYPLYWIVGLNYTSALTNQMLDDCSLGYFYAYAVTLL